MYCPGIRSPGAARMNFGAGASAASAGDGGLAAESPEFTRDIVTIRSPDPATRFEKWRIGHPHFPGQGPVPNY